MVACLTHYQEVAGSSPASATNKVSTALGMLKWWRVSGNGALRHSPPFSLVRDKRAQVYSRDEERVLWGIQKGDILPTLSGRGEIGKRARLRI